MQNTILFICKIGDTPLTAQAPPLRFVCKGGACVIELVYKDSIDLGLHLPLLRLLPTHGAVI